MVTQPRLPCFKLGIRVARADLVKRFQESGRTGYYLRVLREGDVAAGDALELVGRAEHGITVADIVALFVSDAANQDLLQRVSRLPALPEGWREYFRKRVWNPDA